MKKGLGDVFTTTLIWRILKISHFFIKIILLLGDGPAAVECSFIINGSLLDFDKSEESIVA